MEKPTQCMVPSCKYVNINRKFVRGLCLSCHATANKLVLRGKTTWEKLESSGKCLALPPRPVGEKVKWFLDIKVV